MNENGNGKGLLEERLIDYAVRIIALAKALPQSEIGCHIGKQILRSGTSAGANYYEAVGSESRRDFTHKLQICLKELRESLYWLRVIEKAEVVPAKRLGDIVQETNELIAMTVTSIVTVKERQREKQTLTIHYSRAFRAQGSIA